MCQSANYLIKWWLHGVPPTLKFIQYTRYMRDVCILSYLP
uniref:Uncharacterized protein n=1 Tax=Rhizophora mucronata TaxID=61149 RepID=A0A2P2ITV4_RHIMU